VCGGVGVSSALLHGANRPYNVALIYPSWDKLKALALERKVLGVHAHSTVAELKLNDNVQVPSPLPHTHTCRTARPQAHCLQPHYDIGARRLDNAYRHDMRSTGPGP
jgi:hypothetical protein